MTVRKMAVLVIGGVLLAGCTNDSSDLREYLHTQYQYQPDYSALKGASYTYADGDVTVKTNLYTEFTDAQEVCGWVSDWLYEERGEDGSIKVLNRDGDTLSQRRAARDVCSFG